MASLKEILSWFEKNKYPTQEQFKESWTSFWHKSEKMPMEQVVGLQDELSDKALKSDLNAVETELKDKASKEELANVVAGLVPMGSVANLAELETKPKRNNDSYYVEDQLSPEGDAYIYRWDADMKVWVNTKQVVFKDVAKSGGSNKTIQEIDQEKVSISQIVDFYIAFNSNILSKNGFIRPDGTEGESEVYKCSDYLFIKEGIKAIELTTDVRTKTVSPLLFYNANKELISASQVNIFGEITKIYYIPSDAIYYRFSCYTGGIHTFNVKYPYSKYASIDMLTNETTIEYDNMYDSSAFIHNGFIRANGTEEDNESYRTTNFLSLLGIKGILINTEIGSLSVSPIVFYDKDKLFLEGVHPEVTTEHALNVDIPPGAEYFRMSIIARSINKFNIKVKASFQKIIDNSYLKGLSDVYISPYGNDSNKGVINSPLKSLSKAIEVSSNNATIHMLEGDYFDLDCFHFVGDRKILGNNARIIGGTKLTSATLVPGYSKVFSCPCPYSIPNTDNSFLWQHDIPCNNSLINEDEYHPLQRGEKYRLPSSRLIKVNSIEEIESLSNDFLFWYKESDTLYFSKRENSDLSKNPIVIPNTSINFFNQNIDIIGVVFMYNSLRFHNCNGILKDITSLFCGGSGCFAFADSLLNFYSCRAGGANNDGFNGHNTIDNGTSMFFDCWSHDCNDDAHSSHQYSVDCIYGGLYEYCGNGITPASGCHMTCYNSTVRKMGNHKWTKGQEGYGYSAQGTALDKGVSTSMSCFSCLSKYNTIGYRSSPSCKTTILNCVDIKSNKPFDDVEEINSISM